MKKIFISYALYFLLFDICSAQSLWQRTVGGINFDFANSIIQTTDGGYAVAGGTNSFGAGSNDFYIVKLDASGTLQWSKTVGGTNNDVALTIIQTTDGGYAVAGYTNSFGAGDCDVYIVKLSASGTLQWSKAVGGPSYDDVSSIAQTTDGGYAAAGKTTSFGATPWDMYIVKLNANGTLQWSRTIGGTSSDLANSIIQTADGGYAIAGANGNMCIVKLNGSGSVQWSRAVGGTSGDGIAYSIIQTTDGRYVVAGTIIQFGAGNEDMYIVKLDDNGTLQWSKTVGGTNFDVANSIIQTTDGGYAVAGRTNSFGAGGDDMYIVKLNSGGALVWSRTVGGTNWEQAYSIIQTIAGGYAVAGLTSSFGAGNSDMYIVKLDANGNICGNSTSPPSQSSTGGTIGTPTLAVNTPTPIVTIPYPTMNTGGTFATICVIGIQPISNEIPTSFQLYQNHPNPFNPTTNIKFDILKSADVKLVVYDVLGREVTTLVNEKLKPGSYEVEWNASNMPSGVYFYGISTNGFSETRKMILVK